MGPLGKWLTVNRQRLCKVVYKEKYLRVGFHVRLYAICVYMGMRCVCTRIHVCKRLRLCVCMRLGMQFVCAWVCDVCVRSYAYVCPRVYDVSVCGCV